MSQFRSSSSNKSTSQNNNYSLKSLRSLLASSCLLLTLAACGGGGGGGGPGFDGGTTPPPTPPVVPPASASYKIGTGSGGTYQDGVISATDTDLDVGESITLRVNVVTSTNEVPTLPVTVSFSSPCIATGLAVLGTQTSTTPGLFSVPYTNNGCSGEDIVTAKIAENGDSATIKLTLREAQALSVTFDAPAPPQDLTLSLAGIGGQESMELTFSVTGAQGAPIVGQQVTFSINTQVGGASILAGRETGLTDQNGKVRTIVKSGTIAGPVNVLAVHNASGRQGLSGDIVISTGIPEASRFSMSYGPQNPPGAFRTDGIEVDINMIVSDTFGNDPPDGTRISFIASESGNIDSFCPLVLGRCTVKWISSSPRPTNGVVTLLAYTDGAEDFEDRNGNSVYDQGDGPFIDTPEPFADENENGRYDLGEFFFDTNRNGVWDIGNRQWDGPCLTTVSSTAICNGNKTVAIWDSVVIALSTDTPVVLDPGDFPPVGNPIDIQQGTTISLGDLYLSDNNGNALSLGTTANFSIQGLGVTLLNAQSVSVPNTTNPTAVSYGITLVAAPVLAPALPPTGVQLILTIQPASYNNQNPTPRRFIWPINITP